MTSRKPRTRKTTKLPVYQINVENHSTSYMNTRLILEIAKVTALLALVVSIVLGWL